MAERLNKRHQDLVREKIKISNIIDRLEKHVAGLIELTPQQVTSAKILLDKTISNAPTEINQTVEIKQDWTDADEKRLSYLTSKLVGLESRTNETLQ